MNEINHIAFIMDGNRRWAKKQNKPASFGHKVGADKISKIILECKKQKIKEASFFAFSTENWNRSKTEVNFLIKIITNYMSEKNLKWFIENDVRINLVGFDHPEITNLIKQAKQLSKQTKNHKSIIVNICFNYGSQQEIIEACKKCIKQKIKLNIDNFTNNLFIKTPVDLLIRTSGEQRISNFLLFQIAYAEIIFEEKPWPEYDEKQLRKNILEYNNRDRRFGAR